MMEKNDADLFLTAGGNLTTAHLLAENFHLAEGTPEYETFRQVKILLEEAALQQTAESNVRE